MARPVGTTARSRAGTTTSLQLLAVLGGGGGGGEILKRSRLRLSFSTKSPLGFRRFETKIARCRVNICPLPLLVTIYLARSYPAAPADPRTGSRASGTSFLTRRGGNSLLFADDAGAASSIDFVAIVLASFSACGAAFSTPEAAAPRRAPVIMIRLWRGAAHEEERRRARRERASVIGTRRETTAKRRCERNFVCASKF